MILVVIMLFFLPTTISTVFYLYQLFKSKNPKGTLIPGVFTGLSSGFIIFAFEAELSLHITQNMIISCAVTAVALIFGVVYIKKGIKDSRKAYIAVSSFLIGVAVSHIIFLLYSMRIIVDYFSHI